MPEWKSWTFGGDEDNPLVSVPSPAPEPESVRAPEVDEAAAKWGVEVEPVTIARVERVVEGDGLPHGSSEFVVVTEVDGHRMQFHREPAEAPWLQVEARLELSEEDTASLSAYDLTRIANQWNTDHLQPTVFPLRHEGAWVLVLATRFFVAEGLSDRQIHTLVRRGVAVTSQALRELPALITPGTD